MRLRGVGLRLRGHRPLVRLRPARGPQSRQRREPVAHHARHRSLHRRHGIALRLRRHGPLKVLREDQRQPLPVGTGIERLRQLRDTPQVGHQRRVRHGGIEQASRRRVGELRVALQHRRQVLEGFRVKVNVEARLGEPVGQVAHLLVGGGARRRLAGLDIVDHRRVRLGAVDLPLRLGGLRRCHRVHAALAAHEPLLHRGEDPLLVEHLRSPHPGEGRRVQRPVRDLVGELERTGRREELRRVGELAKRPLHERVPEPEAQLVHRLLEQRRCAGQVEHHRVPQVVVGEQAVHLGERFARPVDDRVTLGPPAIRHAQRAPLVGAPPPGCLHPLAETRSEVRVEGQELLPRRPDHLHAEPERLGRNVRPLRAEAADRLSHPVGTHQRLRLLGTPGDLRLRVVEHLL